MNSLIPISRNIFLHILFLLVIGPFSKAQELDSSRPEEPILWANSIHLAYGLVPSSLDLLLEVYSMEGIVPSEQRRKIPALLEEYYIQQKSDSTLVFGQFIRSTFKNSEAVNPELFTLAANSPILISGRAGQITYGINDSVFLALYEFLESQEIALEEWDEKFGELLLKYQQLERDLELRRDNLAKEALIMLKRGEIEEALGLLRERYEFSIREVDRARKEQALAAYDYGNILELRLKYRDATDVYYDAIENDPENTQYINYYCLNLIRNGRYDEVVPMYEKAIQLASTTYGKKNSNVSELYNNLGGAWLFMGDFNLAAQYYAKALDIDTLTYGKQDPNVAMDYSNLANAFLYKGDYDHAINFLNRALEIDSLALGKFHNYVATDYNNLGSAWTLIGNYDFAIKYHEQALEIDTMVLGKMHPNVARDYNNLGTAWDHKGEFDIAIIYIEKAIGIDILTLGKIHPNLAIYYNNLGSAWDSKGHYDLAISYYEQALDLDSLNFGMTHPSVARDYNNLGFAWNSKGKYDLAINYYEKTLEIAYQFLPEDHPNIKSTHRNISRSQEAKGILLLQEKRFDQAIPVFLSSLWHSQVGKDHSQTIKGYNSVGSSYMHLGTYDSALFYLDKGISLAEELDRKDEMEFRELTDSLLTNSDLENKKPKKLYSSLLELLYFHKASTLNRMGQRVEAEKIFNKLKENAIKENDLEFLDAIELEISRRY